MVGLTRTKVNYILDADIRSFFDEVSQQWLIRFLEHRVGDKRIICLIRKWLKAGVLEDGSVTISEKGTGQGSVISPLLCRFSVAGMTKLSTGDATGDRKAPRHEIA